MVPTGWLRISRRRRRAWCWSRCRHSLPMRSARTPRGERHGRRARRAAARIRRRRRRSRACPFIGASRSRPTLPPGTSKITFTSGTTGTPKGVPLSSAQQWAVARALAAGHAPPGIAPPSVPAAAVGAAGKRRRRLCAARGRHGVLRAAAARSRAARLLELRCARLPCRNPALAGRQRHPAAADAGRDVRRARARRRGPALAEVRRGRRRQAVSPSCSCAHARSACRSTKATGCPNAPRWSR